MLGKVRFGSNPSKGVVLESGIVGSSDVPNLPNARTMSSMESAVCVCLYRIFCTKIKTE